MAVNLAAMSSYVVGDLQGCLQPLQNLLARVNFSPEHDRLYCLGDLVNRGPQSLATLRFLYNMGDSVRCVLGNHDLHLLAIASGAQTAKSKDTFTDVLTAVDRDELLSWLRAMPLMITLEPFKVVLSHAGIAPQWSLQQAQSLASEVVTTLAEPALAADFFQHMYGNEPSVWADDLATQDRLRLITNYFTRMRLCDAQGRLELLHKTANTNLPVSYKAWFDWPSAVVNEGYRLIFGHWAALEGQTGQDAIIALDTGCVWGRSMTLLCLDDNQYHHCQCQ